MQTKILQDGTESFKVMVHKATINSPVVLFAVGAGGQPERYTTLVNTLAGCGCMIVAPRFERLASPAPREEELTLRARRLSLALDAFVQPGITVAGVGHSIGAATLIALAGAQMWLGPGRCVNNISPDSRLTLIALLAPLTGFFQAPGHLIRCGFQFLHGWARRITSLLLPKLKGWLMPCVIGKQWMFE